LLNLEEYRCRPAVTRTRLPISALHQLSRGGVQSNRPSFVLISGTTTTVLPVPLLRNELQARQQNYNDIIMSEDNQEVSTPVPCDIIKTEDGNSHNDDDEEEAEKFPELPHHPLPLFTPANKVKKSTLLRPVDVLFDIHELAADNTKQQAVHTTTDILQNHPGNRYFATLLEERLETYTSIKTMPDSLDDLDAITDMAATAIREKAEILDDIYLIISLKGGRFLLSRRAFNSTPKVDKKNDIDLRPVIAPPPQSIVDMEWQEVKKNVAERRSLVAHAFKRMANAKNNNNDATNNNNNDDDEEDELDTICSYGIKTQSPFTNATFRNGPTKQDDSFPMRLHRMLQKAEDDGKEAIVSFLPHGRSFCFHDPEAFENVCRQYSIYIHVTYLLGRYSVHLLAPLWLVSHIAVFFLCFIRRKSCPNTLHRVAKSNPSNDN